MYKCNSIYYKFFKKEIFYDFKLKHLTNKVFFETGLNVLKFSVYKCNGVYVSQDVKYIVYVEGKGHKIVIKKINNELLLIHEINGCRTPISCSNKIDDLDGVDKKLSRLLEKYYNEAPKLKIYQTDLRLQEL